MDRETYLELESILRDIKAERANPRHLPFEFLKYITNNFSAELELGTGGFGVVYKGVLKYGEIVVVKRLRAAPGTLDKQYENEAHLLRLRHENIVRILGFCSETTQELVLHQGRYCRADILERLICLEYMPNGSLDRYIKDTDASSGPNWNQRYKIIKGICCGLHFLHEENQINTPVIHLDLKPANILLTNGMVPKITDFGLSRLFGEQQTRKYTEDHIGTRGYMAPEFWLKGKITKKSDIFSLGVIILEMITGNKDYPWSNDTAKAQNYIEIEVQKWREHRMEDLSSAFVESNCRHIKKCIEIGLKCVNTDEMKRPTSKEIIKSLNRSLDSSHITSSRVGGTPALEGLGPDLNELPFEIANLGPSFGYPELHWDQVYKKGGLEKPPVVAAAADRKPVFGGGSAAVSSPPEQKPFVGGAPGAAFADLAAYYDQPSDSMPRLHADSSCSEQVLSPEQQLAEVQSQPKITEWERTFASDPVNPSGSMLDLTAGGGMGGGDTLLQDILNYWGRPF